MRGRSVDVDSEATESLTNTTDALLSAHPPAVLGTAPPAASLGARTTRSAQERDPGRYTLLGEHGRGALGRVTRAHDVELGRDVAIKELISRDPASEARFLREALITARLEHPGIVAVHEAGRWPDGTPFYAMKLVSGRALRELIAERESVAERIGLLHHVIAVADAIAYAHGRGVIHRDLKPANIIVGDFGETVVIDWGLAKDLNVADEPAGSGSRAPHTARSELTEVGAVLGTPAYMAPEQERAEHVDQRADVYAIGVMLWELCATSREIPEEPRERDRELRRTGIDHDLAAIIGKAIDPEPARRYGNAGALAHDLKAFKSGARIAARKYSLPGMIALWTRQHRTLAASVATALAVAILGGGLFVRDVVAERDRADASEAVTRRARASAEASLDELTLNHAQLLLATDPSAAVDALDGYRGTDRGRADQIRAEANGRGVAFIRATPHTEAVFWTEAAPDGAILSLSADGTIARTALDGRSQVVARGVAKIALPAYTPARQLLAYTCDPSDICLFDVARGAPLPAPLLRDVHVVGIAFSPDGAHFATMSQDGILSVFQVVNTAQPIRERTQRIAGAVSAAFVDDEIVTAASTTEIEFLGPQREAARFPISGISHWATDPTHGKFVVATIAGQAILFEGRPLRVGGRAALCHGAIHNVQFIPGDRGVAYTCSAGTIGTWDPARDVVTPRAQVDGRASQIVATPGGDYLIATGGNGIITVIDLQTDLSYAYRGHGFRLTSLSAPTRAHPYIISADVSGAVRAWRLPLRFARVAATASEAFLRAVFDRRRSRVIATTWLPVLSVVSRTEAVREVGPHEVLNPSLEQSATGEVFATYGLTDVVEIWSTSTMTRTRVIATGHGSVSQLTFVASGDDFVTSGHDGRLVRWGVDGAHTLLATSKRAIDRFALTAVDGSIVFSDDDGAVWRTIGPGQAIPLRTGGARVTRLLSVPQLHAVYVGYASGDVTSIDTSSWQQSLVFHGAGSVLDIAISPSARALAVTTSDRAIHIGTWPRLPSVPADVTWTRFAALTRDVSLTADGLLVAAATDGLIWLYSIPRQSWLCLSVGTMDLGWVAVSDDGKAAVALAREGKLLWIDLDAAHLWLDVATHHVPATKKEPPLP